MNETKKARFNFIDALIILVILAIIGAAVYLIAMERHANRSANLGNVDYIVRISGVDEDALAFIAVGDTVKDSVSGEVMGIIRAVKTEKTAYYGSFAKQNADGSYTLAKSLYPDRYDVYVTISANAAIDARGIYYLGTTKLLTGSAVYFKVPSFAAVSYVTEVYKQ